MDTPLNDRWEFVNCRPVNICVTCGKDFGDEYMRTGYHPNVTALASTIRCQACVKGLEDGWVVKELWRSREG